MEFNKGMSISDIALKHSRTKLAIRARLNRLGLTSYRREKESKNQLLKKKTVKRMMRIVQL